MKKILKFFLILVLIVVLLFFVVLKMAKGVVKTGLEIGADVIRESTGVAAETMTGTLQQAASDVKDQLEELEKVLPSSDSSDAPSQNTVEPEKKTEQPSQETPKTGIRSELKDFLESYEAFADEYVAFVKNYDKSDIAALTRYTALLEKETEFSKAADNWKNTELNDEELLYYTEVTTRVAVKLIEAAK